MFTIYHNPRCAKSRAGLKYLTDKNVAFQIVEYLKNTLSAAQIKDLAEKSELKPMDLVRTQEDFYKKELKGKSFSDKEWFQILADHPKLLQRPIVIKDNKGVLAQPPENIDNLK